MIGPPPIYWTLPELIQYFGPRIFFAVLCGGLIGLERELKSKPAGIKTNMLICLGSSIYTAMSVLISASLSDAGHYGDPSRVAAQIVSGIGFLGGGTIIQARGTIQGLTTAATIWVVAAIGICIGLGRLDVAVFFSVTVIIMLVATNAFEDRILGRSIPFTCEIVVSEMSNQIKHAIHHSIDKNDLVLDTFEITVRGDESILTLHYNGHRKDHKRFILDLWDIAGIREVRQR